MTNTSSHSTGQQGDERLDQLVSTYLTVDERLAITTIAGRRDRSVSYIVRQAIRAVIASETRKRSRRSS